MVTSRMALKALDSDVLDRRKYSNIFGNHIFSMTGASQNFVLLECKRRMGPPTTTIHDKIVAEIYYDSKIITNTEDAINCGSPNEKLRTEKEDKRADGRHGKISGIKSIKQ